MKQVSLLLLLVLIFIFSVSCDEEMQMVKPIMEDRTAEPVDTEMTVAEMKKAPAEPTVEEQPSEPVITPKPEQNPPLELVSITYYSNPQRHESDRISRVVPPGTTVYTEIVFSDTITDTSALPGLYYFIDGENARETPYRRVKGSDLQSGACKVVQGNILLCKFVIPPDASGRFYTSVGGRIPVLSITHPLEVTSITYYSDLQRSQAIGLQDTVLLGTTVYTEIVFSENIPNAYVLPDLYFKVGEDREKRYRIVPQGSIGADFQSGDCKIVQENRLLCKVSIPEDAASGQFYTNVGGLISVRTVEPPEPELHIPFRPRNEYIDPAPQLNSQINRVFEKWFDEILSGTRRGRVKPEFVERSIVETITREFGITYNEDIRDRLAVIYQEVLEMPIVETEYVKLALIHPDKNPNQILAMVRESIQHSVDYDMTYRHLHRRYRYHRVSNAKDLRVFCRIGEEVFGMDLTDIWDPLNPSKGSDRLIFLLSSPGFFSAFFRIRFEFPEKSYHEIVAMMENGYRVPLTLGTL